MIVIVVGKKLGDPFSAYEEALKRENLDPDLAFLLDFPEARIRHLNETLKEVKEYIVSGDSGVIVTYSSEVINFIGLLIYYKIVKADDIKIYIQQEDNTFKVDAKYDNEGILINWFNGLLHADMDELLELTKYS